MFYLNEQIKIINLVGEKLDEQARILDEINEMKSEIETVLFEVIG